MKQLRLKPYPDQAERLPAKGRIILAGYDDDSVLVYQAYSEKIGRRAARLGELPIPDTMSWFTLSFFWMMHQSKWTTVPKQKSVIAIWIQRTAFDQILAEAVQSKYQPSVHESKAAWREALESSDVRVQWGADYPPTGAKLRRQAIQLGLGSESLQRLSAEGVIQIEAITAYVREQAEFQHEPEFILCPSVKVYPVKDAAVAHRLMLDKST